jgi:hypothetical protein
LLFSTITQAAVFVSNFEPATPPTLSIPPSWQIIRLETHVPATKYRQLNWDGVNAIEASADSSMALLGRLVDVDLHETPMLCWLWRTDSVVKSANMTKRQGDDYAARTRMPNAYTSRAQMVVRRTGNLESGKWVAERVNVLEDLHRTFGTTNGKLKLLAIASDSDNTKEKVRAGFADIAFVRADEACPATSTQN